MVRSGCVRNSTFCRCKCRALAYKPLRWGGSTLSTALWEHSPRCLACSHAEQKYTRTVSGCVLYKLLFLNDSYTVALISDHACLEMLKTQRTSASCKIYTFNISVTYYPFPLLFCQRLDFQNCSVPLHYTVVSNVSCSRELRLCMWAWGPTPALLHPSCPWSMPTIDR